MADDKSEASRQDGRRGRSADATKRNPKRMVRRDSKSLEPIRSSTEDIAEPSSENQMVLFHNRGSVDNIQEKKSASEKKSKRPSVESVGSKTSVGSRRNTTMSAIPNKNVSASKPPGSPRRNTAMPAPGRSAPPARGGQSKPTTGVMLRSVLNRMTKFKGLATLTPEQVDAVFDEFDADKSGEIDHNEFRRALQKMGMQRVPKADVDVMIRETDTNNDGVIDRAEFHTMVNKLREGANKKYQDSRRGGRPPPPPAPLAVPDIESDELERASGTASPTPRQEDEHYEKKGGSSCCCFTSRLVCCTMFLCYLATAAACVAAGYFAHQQGYKWPADETTSELTQSANYSHTGWDDAMKELLPFFQDINETMASFGGMPVPESFAADSGDAVIKQAGVTTFPTYSNTPTYTQSSLPSMLPSTSQPSAYPSYSPTTSPSDFPSSPPTLSPTISHEPTVEPSVSPSSSPTGIPGCPDELTRSVSLGDDNLLVLNYEIVEYQGEFGAQNGGGLLCAMLDYTGSAGWLGVAFSEAFRNPEFGRKEAIIGIPGIVTFEAVGDSVGSVSLGQQLGGSIPNGPSFMNPAKYEIPAGGIGDDAYSGPSLNILSSSEKQTLVNGQTILFDQDGTTHTQMYFTKVLEEPDEIKIDPYAYTLLLYTVAPWDSSSGEYDHNPDWSSTTVNFLSSSLKSGVARKRQRVHNYNID